MDETARIVRDFYDTNPQGEWSRIAGRPEFFLTCRMRSRYLRPGDSVLDIGGGPGRYSLYLAEQGCDVTLLDLSPENVRFAKERAAERGLPLTALAGDAREADELVAGPFDHVLLMGPMYHLLEEADRAKAIGAALALLQRGGVLFVSFVNIFSGIIYCMKFAPEQIASTAPIDMEHLERIIARKSLAGDLFTRAFFIEPSEILPFMARFPLEKLHLFGQEGITSPCERNIMSQPKEIVDSWLDLCEKLWEREDLFSWSAHLMYVGRKI